MTGNYTCKATASLAGTNTLRPDQKDVYLRVLFPPTVSLMIQNTTEGTHNHTIRCTAVGEPNSSTFKLQQWIGSSFIRNITKFMRSSPGEIVMDIDTVSYQDMGTYRCLATNGIPDRNNEVLQKDSAYFNVNSSAKFQMERYSFMVQVNKTATIGITFFSNPAAKLTDIHWINRTGVINTIVQKTNVFSFSLKDVEFKSKIHNVNVVLRGQMIVWNITYVNKFVKGKYMLRIDNGATHFEYMDFLLKTFEPSMTPLNVTVRCTGKAAYISWVSNANRSFDNNFQLLYKKDDEEQFNVYQDENIDAGQGKIHHATIDNLQSKVVYNFKVIVKNTHDSSWYTEIRNCGTFVDDGPDIGCNVAGVAGGITGAFVALIILMLTLIVIKQRRCTFDKGSQTRGKKDFNAPEEEQPRVNKISNGSENVQNPGMRSTYEELQNFRDVHTYDDVGRSATYTNLELQ